MDILDKPQVIAQRDTQNALDLAATTLDQFTHTFGIAPQLPLPEIRNIVFSGMGGSALQAELIHTWPRLSVPFVLSRDYKLPEFVDETTLVIVSSYSGNTEETLSSLEIARAKNAHIIIMAGGGKLQTEAEKGGEQFVLLPKAVQPRMAIFYAFRALIEALVSYGVADQSTISELEKAGAAVKKAVSTWTADIPMVNNPAKQLATQLVGKTPIYYAGPLMAPAAYKWKINTNENAKNLAWFNLLPEFDHNEFMGWTSHPVEKPFAVVDLVSSLEHPRILERFTLGDRLLSGLRPKAMTVNAEGSSELEQLLYLLVFGDFVTLYLGILNGVDPSPVDKIEAFKKELGQYHN